jgi:alpha-beta hydrolase superfamily lysophospholipase
VTPTLALPYPSTKGKRSREPSVDLSVASDPLIVNKGTPRFYAEFRKMNRYLQENVEQIVLPTLILQGGADEIVSPEGARHLHLRLTNSEKKLITYEDHYHEVFNEIEREKVVSDLVSWLDHFTRH